MDCVCATNGHCNLQVLRAFVCESVGMQVQTEVYVMHKVQHPNVLRYEAWYETRNNYWLILELAAGSLAQVAQQDGPLSGQAIQVRDRVH